MTITLTSKEFDEAVLLWLKEQGFSTDRYSISTRVIVGRGDSGSGTRVEATLEPKSNLRDIIAETSTKRIGDEIITTSSDGQTVARRFGQGHSDE